MTTDGPASPPPAPAGASRSHRLRNLLIIVVGFFVTLGVVVGSAMYFFYDRAGGIDRSTPEIVTDQFLDSSLTLKDPARVSLYVCESWSAEQAMQAIDAPTDPRIMPFWGDPVVSMAGSRATVTVRVIFTASIDGRVQQQVEAWELSLVDQDGWRVCGLEKALLDP